MNKKHLPRFVFWLIMPLVVIFVAAGIWLTGQAQQSNYNTTKVIEQVLRVIVTARGMRISATADVRSTLGSLFLSLEQKFGESTTLLQGVDSTRDNAKALVNAWGRQTRVFLYPSQQALRIETDVNAVACRRLSKFYINDAEGLGLKRLDVLLDQTTGLWRLVYDASRNATEQAAQMEASVKAACGGGDGKTVSLTFALRQ